jgi:hypothetical protein
MVKGKRRGGLAVVTGASPAGLTPPFWGYPGATGEVKLDGSI